MEIISRADAMARGLKHYFTGNACKRRHVTYRYIDGACAECVRIKLKARYAANPDKWCNKSKDRRLRDVAAARKKDNIWRSNNLERCRENDRRSRSKHLDARRAKDRKWYAENKPKKAQYNKNRYALSPELFREKSRQWCRANPDKVRENDKKRRPELRALRKKWGKDNPEKVRVLHSNRKARKNGAPGRYTWRDIKALFKKQNNKCIYCSADLSAGHQIDHIHPLARGGSNWPYNLQLTCPTCNQKKHVKTHQEFIELLEREAA